MINSDDDTVSVIYTTDNSVSGPITIGNEPFVIVFALLPQP